MDANLAQLIASLGFPIVACGAMAWYVKYITDTNRDEIAKLREAHETEIKDVTAALNSNTFVIQKLCDKLDAITSQRDY